MNSILNQILLLLTVVIILLNCNENSIVSQETAQDTLALKMNRELIFEELSELAVIAQKHYRTPGSLGGGQNSFRFWNIPDSLQITENGTYNYNFVDNDKINLIGKGKIIGQDKINPVKIEMTVLPTHTMTPVVIN